MFLQPSRLWRPACFALLSGAMCLFLSPLAAQEAKKEAAKSTQSRIEKKTYDFKEAGKEMEYALFVPSGYDKEKKTPLIVALHGLWSNPQQIMRYRGLTDQAEKYGYIVVAPMGYNTSGWYGMQRPGARRNQQENVSELSEKDVMNVLGIVCKEYNIDPDRIFLMGHSMGGGGTWHLGIKYPDIWAGLAPIAPAISRSPDELEKIKNIPVILIQGDRDLLVGVERVRPWADKMKQLGMTHEYIEVPGGGHINVALDNIPKIFEFFNKQNKKQQKH